MELDTQTTVLLSGANGGIGQAIARALRAAGARLVLTARRGDALRPLAEETGARVITADLADRGAVTRLLGELAETPIDVLVANAALPASGSLLDFSVDEIDRALDVNLRAPLVMARVLGERMVARRRGHIVFISSIAGKVSTAQTPLYSATKFGLRGASLGLRKDLARHGVGVTTVFPGFIRDAGMFAETGVKLPAGVGTRSPAQVAEAVLHAVRDNPAEIVVAAAEQRLAAWVAGVSPGLIEVAEKLYDTSSIADEVAEKQRGKR